MNSKTRDFLIDIHTRRNKMAKNPFAVVSCPRSVIYITYYIAYE